MPSYAWKGKSRAGAAQEGVLVADNKDAVIAMLRKQQILVTAVTEKGKEIALPKFGGGISQKEIAIFTRQFSVMIDAGLPLVQCLEILGGQQENRVFQKTLFEVRQDVESGATLADSLKKHPKAFTDLYVNMVAAGEAGGILDTILRRLSEYIEKAVKLTAQVKKALVYPTAVIGIAIGVVWVILTFVIPVFAALFQNLGGGAQLPLPTRIVMSISAQMKWFTPLVVIGGFVAYVFGFKPYYATEQGRRTIDGLKLRIPIVGMLLRKIAVARFCRTLGTLISSGVPILDALDITSRTAGNQVVADAISATRRSIEQGKTISEPLAQTEVFPTMVTQMIAVGEQTGALDTMLAKIADFYDDEVDNAVATLLTLLEPIMISFLGVMIGGIVIAMYMPIFNLISIMP
ncbi:MAG: type II secretion system F family protein [Acidobacteria bacterium]|nr:type II secretion system F family protein [Acidobacteriota bacterium]